MPKRIIDKKWHANYMKKIYCGDYWCEACGDCLACYSGQYCYETDDHQHIWPEEVNEDGR